jgi:hypothetical protein
MNGRLDPYDAYRYYMAIKMHFESDSYNAIKYNYKTSVTHKSFWKRKDKYLFAKIASKFNDPADMIGYFVSQFISDKKWIGDMLSDEEAHVKWTKRNQSLSYTFEQDINKLYEKVSKFDDLFSATLSPYPDLVYHYMQGEISIETVVILDKLTGFIKRSEVTDTILWPEVSKRIQKYSVFVNPDLKKMKEIVLRVFTL